MGPKRGPPLHPRGPVTHLTEEQKIWILHEHRLGLKPADTAKRVGVPDSTVRHFLSSYQKTHKLFPRRGRPRLERDTETIVVPLGEDPFLTLRTQAADDGLPLSAIYKARLENHYRFYKTVPVTSLKQHHKDARVKFLFFNRTTPPPHTASVSELTNFSQRWKQNGMRFQMSSSTNSGAHFPLGVRYARIWGVNA
jgi:hypothetical protein